MTRKIAVVVPALGYVGGVATVAEFVRQTIRSQPDLDLRLISLTMWSQDPCSTQLLRPATWFRGVGSQQEVFNNEPVAHVGARFGDIELQRLKPRAVLTKLVEDCDLIQVVAGTPCWALPVLGLGKPVAVFAATLTAFERVTLMAQTRGFLAPWRKFMTRMVENLDERAMGAADAVLAMNPGLMERARAAANPARTIVKYAPPGIDISGIGPPTETEAPRRHILAVGRLDDPRKNVGMLLEAYALMCAAVPNRPDLVLAGAAGPPREFWSRAEELGLSGPIRFVEKPSNEELSELYRTASIFALSSDEEGFGMVIVEAMARGTPVVVTRCGGPDGIVTDGEDGYLVPCGDHHQMADRLGRLVRDPQAARIMGRKARATVEARFANDVAGRVFLDVYDRLIRPS